MSRPLFPRLARPFLRKPSATPQSQICAATWPYARPFVRYKADYWKISPKTHDSRHSESFIARRSQSVKDANVYREGRVWTLLNELHQLKMVTIPPENAANFLHDFAKSDGVVRPMYVMDALCKKHKIHKDLLVQLIRAFLSFNGELRSAAWQLGWSASNAGSETASIFMSRVALILNRTGTDTFRKSEQHLEELGNAGNIVALTLLGQIADYKKNYSKAMVYYSKAVDRAVKKAEAGQKVDFRAGTPGATGGIPEPFDRPLVAPWNELADLYAKRQEIGKAKKVLEPGAFIFDDTDSFYYLALLTEKYSPDWLAYMSRAASAGHTSACVALGTFYGMPDKTFKSIAPDLRPHIAEFVWTELNRPWRSASTAQQWKMQVTRAERDPNISVQEVARVYHVGTRWLLAALEESGQCLWLRFRVPGDRTGDLPAARLEFARQLLVMGSISEATQLAMGVSTGILEGMDQSEESLQWAEDWKKRYPEEVKQAHHFLDEVIKSYKNSIHVPEAAKAAESQRWWGKAASQTTSIATDPISWFKWGVVSLLLTGCLFVGLAFLVDIFEVEYMCHKERNGTMTDEAKEAWEEHKHTLVWYTMRYMTAEEREEIANKLKKSQSQGALAEESSAQVISREGSDHELSSAPP
ncbi:hypothetical protein K402DRAFT_397012 [Aulographum hederae CBS 113979]|uniref:TPR-like protein n=1 Tax=Aulographum hederae CBS 113979 TaxID=1176131 RepID=A0A6G1GQ68_9PEZI|nr:hypothetical protein K402DRAFT_397012 [Aulographum hederae CBS 113979]